MEFNLDFRYIRMNSSGHGDLYRVAYPELDPPSYWYLRYAKYVNSLCEPNVNVDSEMPVYNQVFSQGLYLYQYTHSLHIDQYNLIDRNEQEISDKQTSAIRCWGQLLGVVILINLTKCELYSMAEVGASTAAVVHTIGR
jgi:hypothetical protein